MYGYMYVWWVDTTCLTNVVRMLQGPIIVHTYVYIGVRDPPTAALFSFSFFFVLLICPCLVFTPCDSMKLILQQKFYWFRSTKPQKHQTLVTERGEVRHTLALSGSMEPSMSLSFLMSLRVLGPGAGLLNPWELRRSLKSSFLRG